MFVLIQGMTGGQQNEKLFSAIEEIQREIECIKKKQNETTEKIDSLRVFVSESVSKIFGMLSKIALTTNKNVVNESILDYHAKQVDTHFKNLPCKTIEELSALDVLLQQENLSVSLVNKIKHFFYHLVNIFFP